MILDPSNPVERRIAGLCNGACAVVLKVLRRGASALDVELLGTAACLGGCRVWEPVPGFMNLLAVYQGADEAGILMPLMENGTLRSALQGEHQGSFRAPQLASSIAQLLKIWLHLRSCKVLHRDIKLDNLLMLSFQPWLFLLADYGIVTSADTPSTLNANGAPMSPPCCTPGSVTEAYFYSGIKFADVDLGGVGNVVAGMLHCLCKGELIGDSFQAHGKLQLLYKALSSYAICCCLAEFRNVPMELVVIALSLVELLALDSSEQAAARGDAWVGLLIELQLQLEAAVQQLAALQDFCDNAAAQHFTAIEFLQHRQRTVHALAKIIAWMAATGGDMGAALVRVCINAPWAAQVAADCVPALQAVRYLDATWQAVVATPAGTGAPQQQHPRLVALVARLKVQVLHGQLENARACQAHFDKKLHDAEDSLKFFSSSSSSSSEDNFFQGLQEELAQARKDVKSASEEKQRLEEKLRGAIRRHADSLLASFSAGAPRASLEAAQVLFTCLSSSLSLPLFSLHPF